MKVISQRRNIKYYKGNNLLINAVKNMEDRQIQIKNKMFISVVMSHWNKVPRGIKDSLQADAATQSFRIFGEYLELMVFEARRCP